jgi:hypothetical protein
MKDPVDHIARPSLPWRAEATITECGLNALKVKTLTRAEYFQRLKDYGRQRAALLTCMTCADTTQRWKTWDEDPRKAVGREMEWECGGYWSSRTDRGQRFKDELIAISALIEAHREEFEATMTQNQQRRDWLEKKAAHGAKKPPPKPPNSLL